MWKTIENWDLGTEPPKNTRLSDPEVAWLSSMWIEGSVLYYGALTLMPMETFERSECPQDNQWLSFAKIESGTQCTEATMCCAVLLAADPGLSIRILPVEKEIMSTPESRL